MADIIIKGTLVDKTTNLPIRFVDVEFVAGNDRFLATTDGHGQLLVLAPHEPGPHTWEPFKLPYKGRWTVSPDVDTYDSHYYFEPVDVRVPDDGDIDKVLVKTDSKKNSKQLEIYVGNTFDAARAIFLAKMKQPSVNPLEDRVTEATKSTLTILLEGLRFVIESPTQLMEFLHDRGISAEDTNQLIGSLYEKGIPIEGAYALITSLQEKGTSLQETFGLVEALHQSLVSDEGTYNVIEALYEKGVPRQQTYSLIASFYERATSNEDEILAEVCKIVSGKVINTPKRPKDNIPCSLCYTRYSTNPTRLQTCLCCAPCTGG